MTINSFIFPHQKYEGNRNDAKQFSAIIGHFHAFFREVSGVEASTQALTVVFDKGNNSAENFALLDHLELHFVGSLKWDDHKDLMQVGNDDARFQVLEGERWQLVAIAASDRFQDPRARALLHDCRAMACVVRRGKLR